MCWGLKEHGKYSAPIQCSETCRTGFIYPPEQNTQGYLPLELLGGCLFLSPYGKDIRMKLLMMLQSMGYSKRFGNRGQKRSNLGSAIHSCFNFQ